MKRTRGFTLIEVMIVIATVLILAAIAIPPLQRALNDHKGIMPELIEQAVDQKKPPAEMSKDAKTTNNMSISVFVALTIVLIASIIVIIFTLISRRKIKAQLDLLGPGCILYGNPEDPLERHDICGKLMDEGLKKSIRKSKQLKGFLQIPMTQIKRIWDAVIDVLFRGPDTE